MENLFHQITETVREAGQLLKSAHATKNQTYQKDGIANFVTACDQEIQRRLIFAFKELTPDAHFLAEEDGMQQKIGDGYCYIIDPLDGTTNFIHDFHHSCVSVALAEHGEVIFGAVYNPYLEEMYTAVRGSGAYLNGSELKLLDAKLKDSIVSFGCARYNCNDTDRIFVYAKELYLHSQSVRNSGSAALDICRVAAGRSGLYVELRLWPWDYGAAALILQEAGGVITQISGEKLCIDVPCSVLAGAPSAWEKSRNLIEQIEQV